MDVDDEELLLAVLNSTPVDRDGRRDLLQGAEGLAWVVARGGVGSPRERDSLLEVRDLLQHAVRHAPDTEALARILEGVASVPVLEHRALTWLLRFPAERELAARAVLAWAGLERSRPGRVRACANAQCQRFFLDRSRSNQARWCSMAVCGNRAKARRHYERARSEN